MAIADAHGIPVVEDACQGILAAAPGPDGALKNAGTWGIAGGFSLHPLKNLNVWGDGGVVVTSDDKVAHQLKLLRNHGMRNRDEIEVLGYNSRLDTLQAIVGNWLIGSTQDITDKRIANGAYYDAQLGGVRKSPCLTAAPMCAGCCTCTWCLPRTATGCCNTVWTTASKQKSIIPFPCISKTR